MTKKQYNRPEDSWLNGVEAALRRAAINAKKLAEQHGTPFVVYKEADDKAEVKSNQKPE